LFQTAHENYHGLKLPQCWLQFKETILLCHLLLFSAHFRSILPNYNECSYCWYVTWPCDLDLRFLTMVIQNGWCNRIVYNKRLHLNKLYKKQWFTSITTPSTEHLFCSVDPIASAMVTIRALKNSVSTRELYWNEDVRKVWNKRTVTVQKYFM